MCASLLYNSGENAVKWIFHRADSTLVQVNVISLRSQTEPLLLPDGVLLSVPAGTRCGGNVAATRSHTPSSPCGGRPLRSGAQPGVGSTVQLPGQPAAGDDEAHNGDGEEDADDGAAQAADLAGAEAAAAAASPGRAGQPMENYVYFVSFPTFPV